MPLSMLQQNDIAGAIRRMRWLESFWERMELGQRSITHARAIALQREELERMLLQPEPSGSTST